MEQNLKSKFNNALKQFIKKYEKNPNVIAILVSGSCVYSKPDKNSDLDVDIVLKKAKVSERGNTWINGIEIEYFINPVSQIKYYFKKETKDEAPCTAYMFANSIVIHQKNQVIDQLIKEAKTIIRKKMPKMNKAEVEFMKYEIDDTKKDLEDVYLKKDAFAFFIVANNLLSVCLKIFYKIHRTQKERPKRLRNNLKQLDSKFEKLFSKAIQEKNMAKKSKAINKIVDYTEKLIGGKRPKEWRLKSKCIV